MRINVQSYNHSTNGERFLRDIERMVESNLSRFSGRITNVDVLLIDESENQRKKGCVIEARFDGGWEPVAVRAHAGTLERAVSVGAEKMEEVLDHKLDASAEPQPFAPGEVAQ